MNTPEVGKGEHVQTRIRTEEEFMKSSAIIGLLQQLAPEELACSWDNVGLLCGRREKEVKRLLLCLDVTDEVVAYGVEKKVDMIVSHHPLLFRPINRLTEETMIGRRLLKLAGADIAYYAMHTNFDCAEYGMAYAAAKKLEMTDLCVLDEPVTYVNPEGKTVIGGIGRIGILPSPVTSEALIALVKEQFSIDALAVYGLSQGRQVQRIAISPGSGKDQIEAALQAGVDALITGDISHHTGLDAIQQGLFLIDAGHYHVEHIFAAYVGDYLRECLSDEMMIETFSEECPYDIY